MNIGKIKEKSEELLIERFKKAFNIYVGCGKEYSRETIGKILGVSLRTIEIWATYSNDTIPHTRHFMQLYYFLPSGFKAMIEDIYDNAEDRNSSYDIIEEHRKFNAEGFEFNTIHNKMLLDGKLDQQELERLEHDAVSRRDSLKKLISGIRREKRKLGYR